ncbi:MAG: nuclear transport factor 2 family protein [Acidimicrobiia bacterium]|nr:nuclear transport factor 2 family protein [Acidimicrobiia bacterium]
MGSSRSPGEQAADEWAVRNVIVRLAQYADGLGSCEQYAELFTVDAEWLMPNAPRHGRADILEGSIARRAEGGVGPGSNSRHIVAATAVEFTNDDEAVADSYWVFYVETNTAPKATLVGHYRDIIVRTEDGWKMARREITFG